MNVYCSLCRDEGWAFCPLGGSPCRDVWVPCLCEIGQRHEQPPRVKAILDEEERDWKQLLVEIPEHATNVQAKRMLQAIFRSFYRGAVNASS